MNQRANPADVVKALQHAIESGAGIKCYDVVPRNAEPPFVYLELTSTIPIAVKPYQADRYTISLHVIAPNKGSHLPLYTLIQSVERALSNVSLDSPYLYQMQYGGVNNVYEEQETNEYHAVLSVQLDISYHFTDDDDNKEG